MPPVAPLDIAIIGSGVMGQTHAAAICAAGDRIAAVVDPDADRRAKFVAEFGGTGFAELAGPVDVAAAVVCTPSMNHLPTTIDLVERGIAVLVEKPHRCPGQDAGPLIDLIAGTGTMVSVGMTTRYQPGIRAVVEAASRGDLGRIHFVSDRIWYRLVAGSLAPWYFDPAVAGGGVALTNGIHSLERVNALLGGPVELVAATTTPIRSDCRVDELATIELRGPNSEHAVISLLWADYEVDESELLVVGTAGTARVDAAGHWTIRTARGTVAGRPHARDDPFRDQWIAFRDALVTGSAPPFGVDQLESTVTLIERVYEADRHGR